MLHIYPHSVSNVCAFKRSMKELHSAPTGPFGCPLRQAKIEEASDVHRGVCTRFDGHKESTSTNSSSISHANRECISQVLLCCLPV